MVHNSETLSCSLQPQWQEQYPHCNSWLCHDNVLTCAHCPCLSHVSSCPIQREEWLIYISSLASVDKFALDYITHAHSTIHTPRVVYPTTQTLHYNAYRTLHGSRAATVDWCSPPVPHSESSVHLWCPCEVLCVRNCQSERNHFQCGRR